MATSHALRAFGRDDNLFRIGHRFRIGFEGAKVRVALEAAVWMGLNEQWMHPDASEL